MRSEKLATDPLADSLCQEAEENSPQFSQHLHDRIMRGVSSAAAPAAARPNVRWHWPIAAAVAAAMVLIFFWHEWHGQSTPLPAPGHSNFVADPFPPLPEIGAAIATISDPAVKQIDSAKYAYLDQDAQRFTHFMIDQIDVLPTQR